MTGPGIFSRLLERDQDPPDLLAGDWSNPRRARTLDLPITRRMLGVDLDGSRRI
jgi:hypothetical protein